MTATMSEKQPVTQKHLPHLDCEKSACNSVRKKQSTQKRNGRLAESPSKGLPHAEEGLAHYVVRRTQMRPQPEAPGPGGGSGGLGCSLVTSGQPPLGPVCTQASSNSSKWTAQTPVTAE